MSEKDPKEMLKEGQENVEKIATEMERNMKDNPWPFVAGAAVVSLFMGFLMGRGTKA